MRQKLKGFKFEITVTSDEIYTSLCCFLWNSRKYLKILGQLKVLNKCFY